MFEDRAQALMLTAHEDRAIVGEIIDTNAYLRTLEQRIAEQGVETTGNDTGKNARRTLSGGERGGISDKIFHQRVGNATLLQSPKWKLWGETERCAPTMRTVKLNRPKRNDRIMCKEWKRGRGRAIKAKKAFETSAG